MEMHLSYHQIIIMIPTVVLIGIVMIWQLSTDCIGYFRFLFLINAMLIAKVVVERQNKPQVFSGAFFSLCFSTSR